MQFMVIIASLLVIPATQAATHFHTTSHTVSIIFFTEKHFGGEQEIHNFGESCSNIQEPYRHNVGSIALSGNDLQGCTFFAEEGCSGEFLLFLEEGSYSNVREWGYRAAFRCFFGGNQNIHSIHHASQSRISTTKVKTGEVVLYKGTDMKGESRRSRFQTRRALSSFQCVLYKRPPQVLV
ncbi:hypothetical protein BKA65DRAFT_474487 [Rhexocercosporidium sp. MPI-PUGE-AT-0058]|nr:hypothetical protein BKA65DRAFT_474487 [Rhexocercosporidium sp. MPI-PUGE-AT-0058]